MHVDMSANLEQGNCNPIMSSLEFYAKESRFKRIENNNYRGAIQRND